MKRKYIFQKEIFCSSGEVRGNPCHTPVSASPSYSTTFREDAGAKIVINDADGTTIAVIEASGASGTGDFWYACDIDGTGTITEIDQLTESPP